MGEGRAILAWVNQLDQPNTAITATSEVSTLSADNLKDPHIAKPWRTIDAGPQSLLVNLDDQLPVAIVAMMGTNFGSSSTWRIQASTSDPLMVDDIVYDSGTILTGAVPEVGMIVHRLPDDIAIAARYWQITIDDTSLTFLQAGRLFLGPSWTPGVNYSYGWTMGYVDLSAKTRSRGGQTFIDINAQYRRATFAFDFLTEVEALDFTLEIDRVCGNHYDVLVLLDPDGPRNIRSAIYGLIEDLSPAANPQFNVFAKTYSIEERL